MDLADTYNQLPFDLSGSTAKNRFRQELFWGISKMFDIFDRDNFCVIFDYKCDIEVHFDDSLEFYQVKSHKIQKPYNFSLIKKIDGKHSILAKLFLLQDISATGTPIKCALVSNAFLQIGKKTISDVESFPFSDLDTASQKIVKSALENELHKNNVDLSRLHYIYTSMNLLSPQDDLKGKIIGHFEKLKGCEPVKPNALFRLIVDTVKEKACYELSIHDYNELVKKKGLTKTELDQMLERHIEKTDDSVAQVYAFIEQGQFSVQKKKNLKVALSKIVEAEYTSLELQQKEIEISKYIDTVDTNTSIIQLAEILLRKFDSSFSIEYNQAERYVFLLLIIKRWEGGKYGG